MKPNIIYESAGPFIPPCSENWEYMYVEMKENNPNSNSRSEDTYTEVKKKKRVAAVTAVYAEVKPKGKNVIGTLLIFVILFSN